MSLVIVKEFETEAVIKGYQSILGEHLSTRPESENEIDKYVVTVTKYAWVIDHLKKGKTAFITKTDFYFLRANPVNTGCMTVTGRRVNFGHGQGL